MIDLSQREELLERGLDDILQMVVIVSIVSRYSELKPHDEPAIISPTLAAVRDLVEPGWAIVGDLVEDKKGFVVVNCWKLTPDEAIARIEREWKQRETPLGLADIAWLELTNAGRAEAERILRIPGSRF